MRFLTLPVTQVSFFCLNTLSHSAWHRCSIMKCSSAMPSTEVIFSLLFTFPLWCAFLIDGCFYSLLWSALTNVHVSSLLSFHNYIHTHTQCGLCPKEVVIQTDWTKECKNGVLLHNSNRWTEQSLDMILLESSVTARSRFVRIFLSIKIGENGPELMVCGEINSKIESHLGERNTRLNHLPETRCMC